MLGKEKLNLSHVLSLQERKKALLISLEKTSKSFEEEVHKLRVIRNDQEVQLEEIREEIKILKTKGMAPQLMMKDEMRRREEEEWERLRQMMERGIEEVEQEKVEPFSTEVLIPIRYINVNSCSKNGYCMIN